jgi:hypothetical protein
LGVLAEVFTPELVDAATAEHGRSEKRRRLLPARLVVYFVLALCLFARELYEEVVRLLSVGMPGTMALRRVNRSSLCGARARLGPEPLESLFRSISGTLATLDMPGLWRGLRLLALDGSDLELRLGRGRVCAAGAGVGACACRGSSGPLREAAGAVVGRSGGAAAAGGGAPRPPGTGLGSVRLAARTLALAAEHGIPAVLTNAVRYADPGMGEVADVLDAARLLVPVDPRKPDRLDAGEGWLKDEGDMIRAVQQICDAAGTG